MKSSCARLTSATRTPLGQWMAHLSNPSTRPAGSPLVASSFAAVLEGAVAVSIGDGGSQVTTGQPLGHLPQEPQKRHISGSGDVL